RGVLVPEILGWCHKTDHSTVAPVNPHTGAVGSLIQARSPALFRAAPAARDWSFPLQPASVASGNGHRSAAAARSGRRAYPAAGTIAIFGSYKSGTPALFYKSRHPLPPRTRHLLDAHEDRP